MEPLSGTIETETYDKVLEKQNGLGGNDELEGGKGDDTIYGGDGGDRIEGNSKSDALYGEAGNDELEGGEASDRLYGGEGDDQLTGGPGPDAFDCGPGEDKILDFNDSEGDTMKSNCESPTTLPNPWIEPTAIVVAIIGVIGSVLAALVAKGKIRRR